MHKLCPNNGVEMTLDAKRGLWRCNPQACLDSWALADKDDAAQEAPGIAYQASPCSGVFEYTEPMTAAEIMA